MFEKRSVDSFQESQARSTKADFQRNWDAWEDFSTPAYAYYEEAAEVDMPLYRVELAKSGRSACIKHGTLKHDFKDKKCPIDNDTEYVTQCAIATPSPSLLSCRRSKSLEQKKREWRVN